MGVHAPHPHSMTQVISNGGYATDRFPFGGHEMVVTYPPGFMNPDQITMTVLATPTNPDRFLPATSARNAVR